MTKKSQKKREAVTLVRAKDGKEYTTSDPSEINSLRVQGYRIQEAKKTQVPSKPSS